MEKKPKMIQLKIGRNGSQKDLVFLVLDEMVTKALKFVNTSRRATNVLINVINTNSQVGVH